MKTAEELTDLTLEFLSEHTSEAALAVALGLVWHLIWERPKHLPFLNDAESQSDTATNSGDGLSSSEFQASNHTRKRTTLLRGNLKKELQLVLEENEELERVVRELRLEIEQSNQVTPGVYHPIGAGPLTSRKRTRSGNAGILRTTIGWTTNELDLLQSCWAILIFGFCLVASRRTSRRLNPVATTIKMLEAGTLSAYAYAQEDAIPALKIIHAYFETHFRLQHTRFFDPNSSTGQAILSTKARFKTTIDWAESLLYDTMIPLATQYSQRTAEYTTSVVETIASIELPNSLEEVKLVLQRKERPPTILLSEHKDKLQQVQESLERKISEHQALEQKTSDLQQALRGKEVLLYEERMKTRSARLDAAKVTLEREETMRKESETTKATALAEVAENQKRLLRGFLSEHIISKKQQDRLRRIDQQNNPKTSKIVLPDPILQGFASAMYLNNVSDLSSVTSSNGRQHQHHISRAMDCRDDGNYNEDDDYYGNPNETRLMEIREEFLRSKMTAKALRPSPITEETIANTNSKINQTSTGSLLWNAASNPATEKVADNSSASKSQQHLAAAAVVAQPAQSSWMEDPASIICDWRTSGNDDEVRE